MIRMRAADPRRERIEDAIVAAALNTLLTRRAKDGQRVTELAAIRMLSMARRQGMRPPESLQLLGFRVERGIVRPLAAETACGVLNRVIASVSSARVSALVALFQGQGVDDA